MDDALFAKLEAEKIVTLCHGNADEFFNLGINAAIAIARQHLAEQAASVPGEAVLLADISRQIDIATEGELTTSKELRLAALAALDVLRPYLTRPPELTEEDAVDAIHADDAFIDATVKYKFEAQPLKHVAQAAYRALRSIASISKRERP